jgi:hypothetical protein
VYARLITHALDCQPYLCTVTVISQEVVKQVLGGTEGVLGGTEGVLGGTEGVHRT